MTLQFTCECSRKSDAIIGKIFSWLLCSETLYRVFFRTSDGTTHNISYTQPLDFLFHIGILNDMNNKYWVTVEFFCILKLSLCCPVLGMGTSFLFKGNNVVSLMADCMNIMTGFWQTLERWHMLLQNSTIYSICLLLHRIYDNFYDRFLAE